MTVINWFRVVKTKCAESYHLCHRTHHIEKHYDRMKGSLSVYLKQGTVLDRIDFNVEQSCIKTEEGLKQLQKVMAIFLY